MESNTTGSGLSMQYNILPTKKEIISRLFQEEKITFDEMWVLLQDNENVRYVPMPQPYIVPVYPVPTFTPIPQLPWTTCNSMGSLGVSSGLTNKITENGNN